MSQEMLSRRAIVAGMSVVAAAQVVSAAASSGTTNEIVVGPGCDFEQVATALASITGNSKDSPYVIRVMPGVYSLNWITKDWVTVVGSGPMATIFEGAGWNRISVAGSNIHLSNFGVRYTASNAGHAAIARSGLSSGVLLENIHIDHFGHGAAVRNAGGGSLLTWWLKDMRIRTEGVGLHVGAHTYCDNLKVLLNGNHSGHPHVGCLVEGQSVRIYLNNCRIGTGYWADYVEDAYIHNQVNGPDDVIGVWMPPGNVARVEIHGLEAYCRNEDTSPQAVNVNVIRAESGWVRAFGCFGQAETPVDWAASKSLYQSGDGKIEQFACRFTRINGETFGSEVVGVQTFTNADDGYQFGKFEGGLHRLDASNGPFTLLLPNPVFADPGVVHMFKKINSQNSVTISLSGARLEGSFKRPILQAIYSTLKIMWDGNQWLRI
jgi:hypothetical protein